jgi:hypothetical protein
MTKSKGIRRTHCPFYTELWKYSRKLHEQVKEELERARLGLEPKEVEIDDDQQDQD